MTCPDWLLLLIGGPAACAFAIVRAERQERERQERERQERERQERECKPAPPQP